jgi:uncharacterized cupin superfamily protein
MTDQTNRRHANVIAVDEAPSRTIEKGTKLGATMRPLAASTGGALIGCNHVEVPPGRAAFPHHYHCAIEEALFVLEGKGTLRIGDDRVEVKAGDYITFPPGPTTAHQLRNTGDTPLRYLALSSKSTTDVVGYPDSNKIAAMGSPSLHFFDKPWIRAVFMADATVDYYAGEETD